jgi:hypothetical protein
MAKKQEAGPAKQQYIVLPGVAIATDTERWTAGSLIELTDEQAEIHIAKGNVAPLDNTTPPEPVAPVVVIHEAEAVK